MMPLLCFGERKQQMRNLTSNASPNLSVVAASATPSVRPSSSLNPSMFSHSMRDIVLTITSSFPLALLSCLQKLATARRPSS